MFKFITTVAVITAAVAGNAFAADPAQDYRSPDAQPAVVSQDLRSPDATHPSAAFVQDLRSPDALASGRFQPAVPAESAHASGSSNWAYLSILIAIPLIIGCAFLLTLRRGRDSVAIGG
jgi:hypothetical protein